MSTYAQVMRQRDAICRIVAQHKADNPRLFGSLVNGQPNANSDVDLLVDALPGATLLDIVRLQQQLQRELALKFDVNTPLGLPADWRQRVLQEAIAL